MSREEKIDIFGEVFHRASLYYAMKSDIGEGNTEEVCEAFDEALEKGLEKGDYEDEQHY